jgi:tRNA A-37 threonylcarbamoyl transferase component Bud32
MKFVIHPDFSNLTTFIEQIPDRFENEGETIHKLRNEIKVMDCGGVQLNVKCFRRPNLLNRVAYSFFRKSKARRAFENGLVLLNAGIQTPSPVAFIEVSNNALIDKSFFISLHIKNARDFREFSVNSDVKGREDILVAFGLFAARMHQLGIQPLDLSIGNILFQKEKENIQFWLVDLNRMRFSPVGFSRACKNFERLRGNDEFFRMVTSAYAQERGFDQEGFLKKVIILKQKSVLHFQKKRERKQRRKALKLRFRHA